MTKMATKYAGNCTLCGNSWAVGDQLFIQKVNGDWVKCTDETCFKEQGGTEAEAPQPKSKFTSTKFPISDAPRNLNTAITLMNTLEENERTRQGLSESDEGGNPTAHVPLIPTSERIHAIISLFNALATGYRP